MSKESRVWRRADPSYHPNVLVTGVVTLGLVCGWLALYSVGIVGALWRLREPDAPAPILSATDQLADLLVLAVQFAVGFAGVCAVKASRRRTLPQVLPARQGTASQAAVGWCTALAAASACALTLDRLGIARFDLSVPAIVESPTLAVVSALSAGLREEPLLAALPVLLLVGRLPIGWIMIIAGAMRGMLYLYFGGGGFVWAALWGAAAVWVYYKYRRLWVLVVVHGFVMNIQSLDRVLALDSAAMVLQWANILVLFGALTVWLVPRALGGVQPTSSRAAPTEDSPGTDYEDPTVELPLVPPIEPAPESRPPVASP